MLARLPVFPSPLPTLMPANPGTTSRMSNQARLGVMVVAAGGINGRWRQDSKSYKTKLGSWPLESPTHGPFNASPELIIVSADPSPEICVIEIQIRGRFWLKSDPLVVLTDINELNKTH